MQANELRLGNWVDYNDYPSNGFTRLNEHLMTCVFSDENWINHFISPIPLTEEILLKCEGIIKHPTIKNRYLFEDKKSSFHISDWDNPSLDIFIDGKYIICVEFLHTFQNLIYVLTDQELNIKL